MMMMMMTDSQPGSNETSSCIAVLGGAFRARLALVEEQASSRETGVQK